MNNSEIENIKSMVRIAIGANVRASKDFSKSRAGLSFWFENYNKLDGPIFSIRPAGLNRHVISLVFGKHASACIEHIKVNATAEAYLLAYALVGQLEENFDVKVNDEALEKNWEIREGFRLIVTLRIPDKNDPLSIVDSVKQVMLPLMAAIAELIGYVYTDDSEISGEIEGEISKSLINKRERNPRNRLLCLSIHGDYCGICGYDPKRKYGADVGAILEVHHIEPLSEIFAPRTYNPIKDLIPLCPNCHRAIHKRNPAYTPVELRELLQP